MSYEYEITWDDLSEDLKELVEVGIYTKEEAIEHMRKYYEETRSMLEEQKIIENAIHCMKMGSGSAVCEDCNLYPCDHSVVEDLARVAIKALEKQIHKTPIIWENKYYFSPTPNDEWGYECPCCGNREIDHSEHHCICGQALNWGKY